jgi:hypothetical protein
MIYHEHREQVEFFRRASMRRYLSGTLRDYIFACANAGTTGGRRALISGVRRKAEGVTPGVPDIECMVAVAPYTGLHIEMKKSRKDGGRPSDVSDEQTKVMARLTKCGRKCTVAFGADEAWAQLLEYLGL